jgi:hypothetical protein
MNLVGFLLRMSYALVSRNSGIPLLLQAKVHFVAWEADMTTGWLPKALL